MTVDVFAPERRKQERHPANHAAVLWTTTPPARIAATLKDANSCGFRIRHGFPVLKVGQLLRLCVGKSEREVGVVWTAPAGDSVEVGLLDQETHLINSVKAGEGQLFVQLISPYLRSLRFTINSIVYNSTDAEEVLQECLLKAIAHLDQFHLGQSLRAWLQQIAFNESLKYLRKRRRHSVLIYPQDPLQEEEELMEQLADRRDTPEQALERQELRAALCAALTSLDEIYREVFVLRDLRQLSMMDAATKLGVSIETAKTRLHRARLQMRAKLATVQRVRA